MVGSLWDQRLAQADFWRVVLRTGTDAAAVELSGSLGNAGNLDLREREQIRDAIGELFTARLVPNGEMPVFGASEPGEATVVLDSDARVIAVVAVHPALSSRIRSMRLHFAPRGDITTGGAELLVGLGSVVGRIDETSLRQAGVSGGFDQAAAAIRAGRAYLDLQTELIPRGELRGALEPYVVPPPDDFWFPDISEIMLFIVALIVGGLLIVVVVLSAARVLRRLMGPGVTGRSALLDDPLPSWIAAAVVAAAGLLLLPDVLGRVLGRVGPLDPESWIGPIGAPRHPAEHARGGGLLTNHWSNACSVRCYDSTLRPLWATNSAAAPTRNSSV